MNDIKFRVWDKELELMMIVVEIAWGNYRENIIGVVACEQDDDILYSYYENEIKDRLVIMQSTELKDKNKNDIYHQDILLKTYINPITGKQVSEYYQVKNEGCCWARAIESSGDVLLYFINDNVKVIGNIYENPGLLEGAK